MNLAMYEAAKSIVDDRRREADVRRVATEARKRSRPTTSPVPTSERWEIRWAGSALTGRRVTLVNPSEGIRVVGRDHRQLDHALANAIAKSELRRSA